MRRARLFYYKYINILILYAVKLNYKYYYDYTKSYIINITEKSERISANLRVNSHLEHLTQLKEPTLRRLAQGPHSGEASRLAAPSE